MKKVLVVMAITIMMAMTGAWAATGTSNTVTLLVNDNPTATILLNAVAELDDIAEGYTTSVDAYSLNVIGTGTGPFTQTWSSPDGGGAAIAVGDETLQSPTLNIGVLAAGTYTFVCAVDNGLGVLNSNVVTLTVYDLPTVQLTTVPAAVPPAPANGTTEVNNGSIVVFTATGAGGWGALTITITKGGIPVLADPQHVIDNSVPGIVTLTVNPTVVGDADLYEATVVDLGP